jgi:hypothetical protein
MLKRDITYEDFNGVEVTEEFYFNLSKSELIELESEYKEGFSGLIQEIIKTQDQKELIKRFKEIVLKAYGIKSEDGKRFIKSEQLREEFSQTAAYNVLFVELATDDEKAAIFINGIMPKDMVKAVQQDKPTELPSPPVATPS